MHSILLSQSLACVSVQDTDKAQRKTGVGVCVCVTWKDQQSREIKVNDMKQKTNGGG